MPDVPTISFSRVLGIIAIEIRKTAGDKEASTILAQKIMSLSNAAEQEK